MTTILGRTTIAFLFVYWFVVANQNPRKRLGRAIRARREKADMSQEKLAEFADLSRNFIGMVERGEDTLSVDALLRIAKALKVRVRELVKDI